MRHRGSAPQVFSAPRGRPRTCSRVERKVGVRRLLVRQGGKGRQGEGRRCPHRCSSETEPVGAAAARS
jgi:hypothetical protein